MQKLNYLDLFSGIGGFHLGLKWAGFEFNKVFYSDIEEYANKVYKKNFPDAIPLGDVTKIDPHELPKIDIVTGGFPCQDISCAGNQKGLEYEGNKTRSGLWSEIRRLCSILRPRVIICENVANLITGNNGLWFKRVLGDIAEIGYDAEWQIISAKEIGLEHKRERVWIISYPMQSRLQKNKKNINWAQRIEGLYRPRTSCDISRDLPHEWKDCERYCPDIRKDNGIPNSSHRIKSLGNAVVPQVVQLIGELIKESGILKERCPKKEK